MLPKADAIIIGDGGLNMSFLRAHKLHPGFVESFSNIGTKFITEKHFAFLPTKCRGNKTVFFESYFKVFKVYFYEDDVYNKPYFCDNITEEDLIIAKLTDNL